MYVTISNSSLPPASQTNRYAQNNPLHISIFPSHDPTTNKLVPIRTPLQFSLLLSSTLDIFELRAKNTAVVGVGLSGDFGLLHAVDERLAAYGFETNTGVKFVAVVDMRGRRIDGSIAGLADKASRGAAAVGLREGEMKPVCSGFDFPSWYSSRLTLRLGIQGDTDGLCSTTAEPILRP